MTGRPWSRWEMAKRGWGERVLGLYRRRNVLFITVAHFTWKIERSTDHRAVDGSSLIVNVGPSPRLVPSHPSDCTTRMRHRPPAQ